jgi:hypothetical protein
MECIRFLAVFSGNPEKQLHVAALLLFVLPIKSLTIKVVTVLPIFQTNHAYTPFPTTWGKGMSAGEFAKK